MNKILTIGTFTSAFSVLAAPAAFAEAPTTVVTPDLLQGWADASIAGGTTLYVDGSPAGLGSSSLELKTTDDTASKAVYAHPEDMKLSDLQSASYWTKQVAATSDGLVGVCPITAPQLTHHRNKLRRQIACPVAGVNHLRMLLG